MRIRSTVTNLVILCILLSCGNGHAEPSSATHATVVTYPKPYYAVASSVFSTAVNGRPLDTAHFTDYHYAHFSCDGTVTVAITANETIKAFDISPHSLHISGQRSGRTLRFAIQPHKLTPSYLVIQINDLEKLVILADPIEAAVPPSSGVRVHNVKAAPYNADRTGAKDVTAVIQKAIDDAGNAGGGTVYVSAGVYKVVKTLRFTRDNVVLYLEGGAVVRASENRSDYAANDWTKPVIRVENASNVSIRGRGIIDASGLSLFDKSINKQTGKYEGRRGVIRADGCTNLTIDGITVKDGTTWTLTVYTSEKVRLSNVKVLNYKNVAGYKIQNDGIDICSCRHTIVDRCFVMTIDDPLCAKATEDNHPMYDVAMTNNVLFTSCAGQKSGMQAQSPMHDIRFANNDVIQCRRGIVVESTTGNARMYDIHYLDIRVEHQVATSTGTQKNIDFVAETADHAEVEISRVTFEEPYECRFNVHKPNSVTNVHINDSYAGGIKIGDLSRFKQTGDGEVSGIVFDGRSAESDGG